MQRICFPLNMRDWLKVIKGESLKLHLLGSFDVSLKSY